MLTFIVYVNYHLKFGPAYNLTSSGGYQRLPVSGIERSIKNQLSNLCQCQISQMCLFFNQTKTHFQSEVSLFPIFSALSHLWKYLPRASYRPVWDFYQNEADSSSWWNVSRRCWTLHGFGRSKYNLNLFPINLI